MVRPSKFEEPLARPRSFRLRQAEDEKFAKKLKEANLETSEYIRNKLLEDKTEVVARPQRKNKEARLELLRMVGQLQRLGNNINQLAYRANADHLAGTLSEQTYRDLLSQLEDISLDLKSCLPKWD